MSANTQDIVIINETDPRFAIPGVLVAAGAVATITPGVPTKSADAATAATGAIVPMVDGDGAIGQNFTGIAKSTSTDTVGAAGDVTIWLPLPGYVYACKAKTYSTVNTAIEVQALFRKRVVFDLSGTGGTWTVDAAAADALINCVTIVGGDYQTGVLWFTYKNGGTMIGQQQTS